MATSKPDKQAVEQCYVHPDNDLGKIIAIVNDNYDNGKMSYWLAYLSFDFLFPVYQKSQISSKFVQSSYCW